MKHVNIELIAISTFLIYSLSVNVTITTIILHVFVDRKIIFCEIFQSLNSIMSKIFIATILVFLFFFTFILV
jgi:hypothetical protein